MKVAILFATMAVTGAAATLCGCAPPEKADSVSLCDVVKNPGAYDKRLIKVSGDGLPVHSMLKVPFSMLGCSKAAPSDRLCFD